MADDPRESLLRWAASAIGRDADVVSADGLHQGASPWRVVIRQGGRTCDLVLRATTDRIGEEQIITGAAALRLAEAHGLSAPRLIAADLDGRATGTVATLETMAPGSSRFPERVSAERLRAVGAALARAHAVALRPRQGLPLRIRPTDVDDRAMEWRWATLYRASPEAERPVVIDALCELTGWTAEHARRVASGDPGTPLLQLADERIRNMPIPESETVFVHGDIWAGNTVWESDTLVVLIDWKNAGVGDPGVDLGNFRLHMALQYGGDAPALVLDGWRRASGREPTHLAYWDVVAALTTTPGLDGWDIAFDERGRSLDAAAVIARRDAFLRESLSQICRDSMTRPAG